MMQSGAELEILNYWYRWCVILEELSFEIDMCQMQIKRQEDRSKLIFRLSDYSIFPGSQKRFWFTFSVNRNDVKTNSCYYLSEVEIKNYTLLKTNFNVKSIK